MNFGTAVNIGTASGGFGSSPPGGFGSLSSGPFGGGGAFSPGAQQSWSSTYGGLDPFSNRSQAYSAAQGRRQQSGGGSRGGGGGGGTDLVPGGSGLFGGQGGGASQRFTPFSDTAGPMTSTSGLYTPEEKPFSIGPTPSWKPSVSFGEWLGDFAMAVAPALIGAAACDIRLKTDIAPLENTEVNDALADLAFFVKEIRECA